MVCPVLDLRHASLRPKAAIPVSEKFSVYVDGFNLYYGLKAKSAHKYLWLDLVKLAERLRPRSTLTKVHYFTAQVLNDAQAAARQSDYLAALKATNGSRIEIVQGRYQSKTMTCHQCGGQWQRHEEKETDVNIAVSLVADAASKSIHTALLISADSDLAPAVRMARRVNPSFVTIAMFPPDRFSAELKTLMPRSAHLGMSHIRNSLLPNTVTDSASGLSWRRPAKWR
ncbi:NYN domain-containing protein [Nocardia abscessus]|nr:NYN domain-containing protein [Nocardia abscessus]